MDSIIVLIADLINFAVKIYIVIIIARAVISFVRPDPYNPAVRALYRLTEPILHPIRRTLMKATGNIGIDFSPAIAIILLLILRSILMRILLS
jgi:YggT family protein